MKHKILRIFFIFFFIEISTFAYDFTACQNKAALSMEKIGQSYGIAIQSLQKDSSPSKSILFFYSPKNPPKGYKILKHDPFVGMYLLESKTNLTPITLKQIDSKMLEDEIASITPTKSVSGKIKNQMQSPIDFASLNTPTFPNSLISTICEHIYGIGIGNNQFIDKKYLDRFINNPIYYGDIGIRVIQNQEDRVEVSLIDPFFENNPFKYGDIIMMVNGEAIPNVSQFNRVVFDLKEGSTIPVRIQRDGTIHNISVKVDKRHGGMLLKEDFLWRIGIEISDDFTITSVSPNAKNGFELLQVGDKVLKINQNNVPYGYNAIIRFLGDYTNMRQKWLISRKDFQFFIEVNRQKASNEEKPTIYFW